MGNTAQFVQFGPYLIGGQVVAAVQVYHYQAGTSSFKDAWQDRTKLTTIVNPLLGDSQGIASAYFDGLYKIVIKDPSGSTLYTFDNVDYTEDEHRLEGTFVWDPPSLATSTGTQSTGITVTGCGFGDFVSVSAPYDLQGITTTVAITASNTVKITLWNGTGSTIDLGSGTWKIRVRQA